MALFRRSVATIVAFLGGLCIAVGGLAWFILGLTRGVSSSSLSGVLPGALGLTGLIVIAFFVLLSSRPRLLWWPGRRTFNALILVGLGVLAWVFSRGFVVIEIGAVLAILGGVLLPFEGLFVGPLGGRRGWFRRGLF